VNFAVVAAAVLTGAAGLALFWRVEKRARNPTLPASIFRSRPFLIANIVTLFLYGALGGVLFLLPFDLIARRGMTASAVGLTMLPFGLVIGLLSRSAGGLAEKLGARRFLVGGSLAVGAATVLLALNLQNYWLGVFGPLVLMALGMAAVVSPLTTVVMNSAPDEQSGAASGINNAASRIAGLIAVAVLGALAGLVFAAAGAPDSARFGELPGGGDPARAGLEQAFLAGYSSALAMAALWCLLAAAAAWFWLTEEECMAKPAARPA
jgi:predicted MFS family arabinose efflux permease